MRDLASYLTLNRSVNYGATTATQTGTAVNVASADGVAVFVKFGTWTDGSHTPKLQDSPDNSVWTDVPAANLTNSTLAAVTSAAGNNTVQRAGYAGALLWVRVVITVSGATTGCVEGADIIQGYARRVPAAVGA